MNALRRALVLTLLFVCAALGTGVAHACSCVQPPAFTDAVKGAEVAYAGTLTHHRGEYVLRVERVLKGDAVSHATLHVNTSSGASCGTRVREGPFVYVGGRDLTVNLCSTYWEGAAATAVLASPSYRPPPHDPFVASAEPVAHDDGNGWLVAVGVVVLAAVAAGAYLLRRRRSSAA